MLDIWCLRQPRFDCLFRTLLGYLVIEKALHAWRAVRHHTICVPVHRLSAQLLIKRSYTKIFYGGFT